MVVSPGAGATAAAVAVAVGLAWPVGCGVGSAVGLGSPWQAARPRARGARSALESHVRRRREVVGIISGLPPALGWLSRASFGAALGSAGMLLRRAIFGKQFTHASSP